jgi:hypothetical protein
VFAGWTASGDDAPSREIIFALAVALDTRRMETELEIQSG